MQETAVIVRDQRLHTVSAALGFTRVTSQLEVGAGSAPRESANLKLMLKQIKLRNDRGMMSACLMQKSLLA